MPLYVLITDSGIEHSVGTSSPEAALEQLSAALTQILSPKPGDGGLQRYTLEERDGFDVANSWPVWVRLKPHESTFKVEV